MNRVEAPGCVCKLRSSESSKVKLHGELHHAWVSGRTNGSETVRPVHHVWRPKRRSIRKVEHFRAEVEIESLRNRRSLDQRQVGILIRRPSNGVSRAGSQEKLLRDSKRIGVEKLRGRTLRIRKIDIGNACGPLRTISRKSVEIRCLRHGKRNSRLDGNNPGDLPAVRKFAKHAAWIQAVAGSHLHIVL